MNVRAKFNFQSFFLNRTPAVWEKQDRRTDGGPDGRLGNLHHGLKIHQ
jgi:hypothetical protein